MGKYLVRLTPYVKEQLEECLHYIKDELQAPDTARSLRELLKSEMKKCADFPAKNPQVTDEPWYSYGIRRMVVKHYCVYYWIDEAERTVWFICMVYSKRNQEEALLHATCIEGNAGFLKSS